MCAVQHREHLCPLPMLTAMFEGDALTAGGTPGFWKTGLTNSRYVYILLFE
jgi:hypothetical protein